jgi:hypothetical protein
VRVSGQEPPRIRELLGAQLQTYARRLVRATDYLVVTKDETDGRTPAGHAGPIELPHGVRIERVDCDIANRVFDATSLRGENWSPTRQFHAAHAYVREAWSEGEGTAPLDSWDYERRIWPVVQLSRLIRDNGTSTEHAAQLQIHADGSERIVPFDGFESHVVYRLYPDRAGWLDTEEAVQLRTLVDAFWSGPELPRRVGRALRQTEEITGARYLQNAIPLVVGGFESLLKIGRQHLSAQFSQRVPAIAAEVDIDLTIPECEDVYDDRSALVHGFGLELEAPHEIDESGRRFNELQETLRRVVRRAIEDRDFAAIFEDEDEARIKERWPARVTVREAVEKII